MAELPAFYNPELIGQIARLGLRSQRVVEGSITGLHRSPLHGVSPEFADYREYAPGDDIKNLDWRAYGRSDRYYIKRFEEESNLKATFIVDASASMRYGQPQRSKYHVAATVATALTALFLRQRDAVGLCLFDQGIRQLLPAAAKQAQLSKVMDALNTEPGGETELGEVLHRVADQLKRRGMVVLISDLLGDLDALYKALGRLQHGGHEIILVQVLHDDELTLPFNDSVLFRDIEGSEELFAEPWAFRKVYQQAMADFLEKIRQRCHFCGFDHVLLRTGDDLGLALSQFLHQRQRQGAQRHHGHMAAFADGAGSEQ